jgi:integrase
MALYREIADLVVKHFGKSTPVSALGPSDFAALRKHLAKGWGPLRLNNAITYVRGIFKYAADNDLIARVPRYASGLDRPSGKVLRLHRAQQVEKLFTREQLHRMLAAADPALRAMVLLGLNCGFGNTDVGLLPLTALDLDGGWINYPKPKTGVPRRCALWPETVAAVREALACRPEPRNPDNAKLAFLTERGWPWASQTGVSPITWAARSLLRRLGINGRKGLGFSTLRHVFRTVAHETRDQLACEFIMGHLTNRSKKH